MASGVSPRTVERVSSEDRVGEPGEHDARARARMGRPSKVAEYESQVKRAYARLVYQRLEGNKRRTCQILGIDYKTLQNRLASDA